MPHASAMPIISKTLIIIIHSQLLYNISVYFNNIKNKLSFTSYKKQTLIINKGE